MDQALSRTRRNLIGVSVVLTLLYAFGWDFPGSLRILGNEITANADVVRILVWTLFTYLIAEYAVHLQGQLRSYLSDWRQVFRNYATDRIEADLKKRYDETKRREYLQKKAGKYAHGTSKVHKIALTKPSGKGMAQCIKASIHIRANCEGRAERDFIAEDEYRAPYHRFGLVWIRTTLRLLLLTPQHFEYILPLFFPLLAIAAAIFGPFPAFTRQS